VGRRLNQAIEDGVEDCRMLKRPGANAGEAGSRKVHLVKFLGKEGHLLRSEAMLRQVHPRMTGRNKESATHKGAPGNRSQLFQREEKVSEA
jgi:hypothetical protein